MSRSARGQWAAAAFAMLLLGGCETGRYTPPQARALAGRTGSNAQALEDGRTLFIRRCVDCHILPSIGKYNAGELRRIVPKMAQRAHLKPGEQDAVLAYILAVRGV